MENGNGNFISVSPPPPDVKDNGTRPCLAQPAQEALWVAWSSLGGFAGGPPPCLKLVFLAVVTGQS